MSDGRAVPMADVSAHGDFIVGTGETIDLIRSKDWSATPLGPLSGWPQSLRTTVSLCLASNFPINIIWGPEHIQIYNDGYRMVCGEAHPAAMGQAYPVTWESAWPAIGAPFERALAGETSFLENQRMFLTRNGYLEETFFTFSLSPIRDETGGIGGLFHPVTETTATMLAERRTRALRDLTAGLTGAAQVSELACVTIDTLSRFGFDLPFLLIYEQSAEAGGYHLIGRHGLSGDAAAPRTIAADASLPWPFGRIDGTGIVDVADAGGVLGAAGCGPYEEPPNRALLLPINLPGGATPLVLVAGASPRLPFDDGYSGFFELIAAALSAALATVRARLDERRRAEALAEIDRAKTAFFSNVSHEFRTPLTLMLAPLEEMLAAPEGLPEPDRGRVALAHRNAQRLLKLVNTLLDFSRTEAGRADALFRPTDLAALTADLASNFRSATEQAGLALVVDAAPLPQPVYVDRDLFEKIILNLLSNAFKFTLQGEIRVSVRLSADKRAAIIQVADTGVGIARDELPQLFDRFHRVDGAPGRSFEGSGIGLALVDELVRLHGGTVSVDSEPGVGSRFTASLPFGTHHLPADRLREAAEAAPSGRADAFVGEALGWIAEAAAAPAAAAEAARPRTRGRVLLAEDNADMRAYIARLLEVEGFTVDAVSDGQAAIAAMQRRLPDCILSDVMMPRLDGFGLLAQIRADPALRDLPFILLSARAGEEAQAEGLEAGADDYLTKPFSPRELVARLSANLQLARDRREAALRTVNAELERQVMERSLARGQTWRLSPDLLSVVNADGYFEASNPAWQQVLGWSEREVGAAVFFDFIHPDDVEQTQIVWQDLMDRGLPALRFENRYRHKDGGWRWLSWVAVPEEGKVYCSARDVTADKAQAAQLALAEEALRQSQKLEAVGQLTGGVAHDFNNLLTVIGGSAEMLSHPDLSEKRRARHVQAIAETAERATRLTSQLLSFARRQALQPKLIDVGQSVAALAEIMRTLMGSRIAIEVRAPERPCFISADPSQFDTALINMAINARDAMEGEGSFTIEIRPTDSIPIIRSHPAVEGAFVAVHLTDTGAGMPAERLQRIFEPFYTTKAVGHGTGLGLSQVFGFAKQSAGDIEVRSAPGEGATFSLYFPRVAAPVSSPDATAGLPAILEGGGACVLVVEDNEGVGAFAAQALGELGYRTVLTTSAASALAELERNADRIDVVFSDVVMPGISGIELSETIRRLYPRLPVVLTSGYSHVLAESGSFGFELLHKPYSIEQLSAVLHKAASRSGDGEGK